jgi:hypothetical protein
MPWMYMYLKAQSLARDGALTRDAELRAMYDRPDALPLPDEAPRRKVRLPLSAVRRWFELLRYARQETAESA